MRAYSRRRPLTWWCACGGQEAVPRCARLKDIPRGFKDWRSAPMGACSRRAGRTGLFVCGHCLMEHNCEVWKFMLAMCGHWLLRRTARPSPVARTTVQYGYLEFWELLNQAESMARRA